MNKKIVVITGLLLAAVAGVTAKKVIKRRKSARV